MAMFPPPRGVAPTAPRSAPSRAPKVASPKIRAPKIKPPSDLMVAQRQVQAAYDPVLQQITNAYNQRGAALGSAINQQTQTLAQLMGSYGPASQQAYDKAAQGMAAVNAMLGATQAGQGAAQQGDLVRQLQGIDQGTAGRVEGTFGGQLAGQQLANTTTGSNALALLLGEGAHAADYGAKLPGIAGGIGLQAQEQTQGQITSDLQNQLAQIAAKEPGAVQDALAGIQKTRADRQAAQALQQYRNAELGLRAQGQASTDYYKGIGANQAQQRLNAEIQHWTNTEAISRAKLDNALASKTSKQPKINTGVSNLLGYLADSSGNPIKGKGGQPIYTTTLPGNVKKILPALTASISNAIKQGADAQHAYKQITAANPSAPQTVVKREIVRLYGPDKVPAWMNPLPAGVKPLPNTAPWTHANLPIAQQQFSAFVQQKAKQYGIDPQAVFAVSRQEGFGGGIGDNNTSFGPFQLHVGGALPAYVAARGADYAQRWAWSPQGWDYALRQIAKVSRGLTGAQAVNAIVSRFERPQRPGKEIAGAMGVYGQPSA